MYWMLLSGFGGGVGCAPETPVVEPASDSHPVSLGQEVVCENPVTGLGRFSDEAESRGITPDVGLPTAMASLGPYAVGWLMA